MLLGAAAGAGVGAVSAFAWCQGDYKGECDDEPGTGPLACRMALIGAGAGALLGWVLDLNRTAPHAANRPTAPSRRPTLVVAPTASRSQKALRLTLRF
jgi:hypothetical protein